MEWIELSAQVDREAVESVVEIFSRYGYGGTVVEEPIIPEPGGDGYSVDPTLPVTVKAYLPDDGQAGAKQHLISEALWHLGQLRQTGPLESRAIAESDWANAWKSHYQVQRIARRIVVKPSWQEYEPQGDEIVVELDPGMAFGTGMHPTTRLCLEALEELVRPGSRVLDVGTGSGILAIAAIKLGASSALSLDLDEIAVASARENVARNDLSAAITVEHRSLGSDWPDPGRFDLVVANITARAIASLAGSLVNAVAPDGCLLLSGIIAEQGELVREALAAAGAQIRGQRQSDDWQALIVQAAR